MVTVCLLSVYDVMPKVILQSHLFCLTMTKLHCATLLTYLAFDFREK